MFVRKSIDVISPADGKNYTSITQYEKSLDKAGQHIMSDKEFRHLRERLSDEKGSTPKPADHNHVHIDFANGRIVKSKKDLNV